MPYIDSTPNNTLLQALRYASMGYKVIPVKWGKKVPACDHGVKDATFDPEQINQWFESSEGSQLNIGLSCEGLLVIDLDIAKGSEKSQNELKADLSKLVKFYSNGTCPAQITRSGGLHLIYQRPPELTDAIKNITKIVKHGDIDIDLKTTGGYIVVSPSWVDEDARSSAGKYRWSKKCPLVPRDELTFPPKKVCNFLINILNKNTISSPVINKDVKDDNRGNTTHSRNKQSLDVQRIKQAASGREKDILRDVAGISEEYLDGKHHPCPKCCGEDRFRWMNEREDKPVFCNQCFYEKNGDVIAAVQWMREVSFLEALKQIGDYLGLNFLCGKRPSLSNCRTVLCKFLGKCRSVKKQTSV